MEKWRIDTKRATDPVSVTDYRSETGAITVEIRIGKDNRSHTRYADLTPWQARKLAVALIWAASGEEPDSHPTDARGRRGASVPYPRPES